VEFCGEKTWLTGRILSALCIAAADCSGSVLALPPVPLTQQVQGAAGGIQVWPGGDASLPQLPHRGVQTGDEDQALDLGGRQPDTNQKLGKKTLVNNFCIGIASNQAYCTSCHIGYGWKDNSFDSLAEENVDCLVCHDTTGLIASRPGWPGIRLQEMEFRRLRRDPAPVDLNKVAPESRQVQPLQLRRLPLLWRPRRRCEDGDLDTSLEAADADVDVHMDATGLDFTCATCHTTTGHAVPAAVTRRLPRMSRGRCCAACWACAIRPPANPVTAVGRIRPKRWRRSNPCRVSPRCRWQPSSTSMARRLPARPATFPAMARGGVATKMKWDWSEAGKMGPRRQTDGGEGREGHAIYDSKKGAFVLQENVIPISWSNGEVIFTTLGDKVVKSDGYNADQPLRRQPQRRQVANLAGEGVPWRAALRPRSTRPW